jgi:ABC-2 type transport system permease protein
MAGLDPITAPTRRKQFAAVAWLRWRMLQHALRTRRGGLETGARFVMQGFYALIGLGMGIGLGTTAWQIASHGSYRLLAALLWPVFIIWQVIPITLASFQENADLSFLLRFPLDFPSYTVLYLLYGLVDISTIVGGVALVGILAGATLAQPRHFLGFLVVLTLFAVFNMLLTRMVFAWINRWLVQRKTREILGAAFLFFILALQLFNPGLNHRSTHHHVLGLIASTHNLHLVILVQSYLPPGLSANALNNALSAHTLAATGDVCLLLLYIGAAAALLSVRLRAEYRGESLGQAPALVAKTAPHRHTLDGSGPISAVIEKELRYLMRSGVMLYQFLAPLVIVFVFSSGSGSGVVGRHGFGSQFALPIGIAYSFLGLTRFLYNNLGAEGAGIQLYFLSPTPFRKVMLAKNMVHVMIFIIEGLAVATVVILRSGWPSPQIVLLTLCWFCFAIPVQLAAGNLISITMPYRLNMARMSREQGAAANGLLSLLIEVMVFVAGAAVYLILRGLGHAALAAPVFLIMAAASLLLWLRVLANSARIFQARQQTIISALYKAA